MNGYMGKILDIDLTSRRIKTRELDEKTARNFIGGSGLGAKILNEETDAQTDPLGPENILIFGTGPFTGTNIFNSDRFGAVSKSPLTGIFAETNAGGFWGGKFKRCGYDALVVRGKADKPVAIRIDDERAEIVDAGSYWGKDTFEATEMLKNDFGASLKAAVIGNAGENGVRYASVVVDGIHGRVLGRCGIGAVMGSKNLKAVTADGNQEVEIADPDKLQAVMREIAPKLRERAETFGKYGTSAGTEGGNEVGNLPVKNWYGGDWAEGATKISGITLAKTRLTGQYRCGKCVL